MGFFDSSSSSTNTTNNYEQNLTTDIKKSSAFQDSGGVLAQGGENNTSNIEILDAGAIGSAFDFAEESQAFWGENYETTLGMVENTNENAMDGMLEISANSFDAIESTNENSLQSQATLTRALSDNKVSEATGGMSKIIMPALFIVGAVVLTKQLRG